MLTVPVKDHHVSKAEVEPVAQAGFDRFPFAAVLFVDNEFGASLARAFRGRVGRPIIDDENVIELLKSSSSNVADVFLFEVSGNDRGNRRSVDRNIVRGRRHFLADDRVEVGRMIRAADERTGGDVREAFGAGDLSVSLEPLR